MIPYKSLGDYGFSNSADHLLSVQQWRDAAVADGWEIRPTYPDPNGEPQDRAAKLSRDGWTIQILARHEGNGKKPGKWLCEAQINIWAPDHLHIVVPPIYSFEEMQKRVRHCSVCKADDVETQRYSFAGRCCAKCRPEMARKYEYAGWTN